MDQNAAPTPGQTSEATDLANMNTAEQVKYARLKASISGHQGWLTKRGNAVDETLKMLQAEAGINMDQDLIFKELGKLDDTIEKMQQKYDEIIELAPHKLEESNTVGKTCFDEITKKRDLAVKITNRNKQKLATLRASDTSPGKVKVLDGLRPGKLPYDATPKELEVWSDQWDSFYYSSKLELAPQTEQRAYLIMCLDEELVEALNTQCGKQAPLYLSLIHI